MANTAHLVRRQSSRDLKPQKSVDKLEMKEMRGRLVVDNRKSTSAVNYGATNAAFEDSSPNKVEPLRIFLILLLLQLDIANLDSIDCLVEQDSKRSGTR